MKVKCLAERREAEAEHSAASEAKHVLTQMMGAVNHGGSRSSNKNDWSLSKRFRLPSIPALRKL